MQNLRSCSQLPLSHAWASYAGWWRFPSLCSQSLFSEVNPMRVSVSRWGSKGMTVPRDDSEGMQITNSVTLSALFKHLIQLRKPTGVLVGTYKAVWVPLGDCTFHPWPKEDKAPCSQKRTLPQEGHTQVTLNNLWLSLGSIFLSIKWTVWKIIVSKIPSLHGHICAVEILCSTPTPPLLPTCTQHTNFRPQSRPRAGHS